VEDFHTELSVTRGDSRGELGMVEAYDVSRVHAAAPSHETADSKAVPPVLSNSFGTGNWARAWALSA